MSKEELNCLNNECVLISGDRCSNAEVVKGKFTCNERKVPDWIAKYDGEDD